MTKDEMFKVMTLLNMTFPNSFNQYSTEEKFKSLCANWYRFFEKDDYQVVMKAVDSFIANDISGFAPTIGQIKKMMLKVSPLKQIDVGEAWEIVLKNARCNLQYAKENYDTLDENIKKALGSFHVLSEIGYMTNEQVTFARKEFERKYNYVIEDEKMMYLSGAKTRDQIETGINYRLEDFKSVEALRERIKGIK